MRKIRILESVFWQKRTDYAHARLRVEDFATGKNFSFNLLYCNKEICFFTVKVEAVESVFPCICMPWSKHSRGWENTRQFQDEVERLHNCLEFSQPLSCYTRGNHWWYGSAFVSYGKITETNSSRKESSFPAEVPPINSIGAANLQSLVIGW